MEKSVGAYLESLCGVCAEVLNESLTAVWIVGSLATGDFDPRCSDVDVLVVSRSSPSDGAKTALGQRLSHSALRCPAHGIDLLVYRASEIADLPREPSYEFSISSGIDWDDEIGLGGPYAGGLIDLATAYDIGESILGPNPRAVLGRCADEWLLEELQRGVEWHRTRIHDPFHDPTGSNAVLNACRALYFLSHRTFASKSEGAGWFLSTREAPVIAEALTQRRAGRSVNVLDAEQVLEFLDFVAGEFKAGDF